MGEKQEISENDKYKEKELNKQSSKLKDMPRHRRSVRRRGSVSSRRRKPKSR